MGGVELGGCLVKRHDIVTFRVFEDASLVLVKILRYLRNSGSVEEHMRWYEG